MERPSYLEWIYMKWLKWTKSLGPWCLKLLRMKMKFWNHEWEACTNLVRKTRRERRLRAPYLSFDGINIRTMELRRRRKWWSLPPWRSHARRREWRVQVVIFKSKLWEMMRYDAKLVMYSIDKLEWPLYRPWGDVHQLTIRGWFSFWIFRRKWLK